MQKKTTRHVFLYSILVICFLVLCYASWERINRYVNRRIVVQETFVPFTRPPNIVICPVSTEKTVLESRLKYCKKYNITCIRNEESYDFEHKVIEANLPLSEYYDIDRSTPEEAVKYATVENFGEPEINIANSAWKKTPYFFDVTSYPSSIMCYSLNFSSYLSNYKIPVRVRIVFKNHDGDRKYWGSVFLEGNDDRRYLHRVGYRIKLDQREYAWYKVNHYKMTRLNRTTNLCQPDQEYNYTQCRMDHICGLMKQRNFKCQPYLFDCKEDKLPTCPFSKVQALVALIVRSEKLRDICPEKCSGWKSTVSYVEGNPGFPLPELLLSFDEYETTIREESWNDSISSLMLELGVLASILVGFSIFAYVFATLRCSTSDDKSKPNVDGTKSLIP